MKIDTKCFLLAIAIWAVMFFFFKENLTEAVYGYINGLMVPRVARASIDAYEDFTKKKKKQWKQ